MKKIIILSFFLALFLFACTDKSNEKPLIIGTNTPYEPMEYKDSSGNLVGLDIDLIKELAKEMGREIVIKEYGWDELFIAVDSGEVDLAISSITITLERQEKYEFSSPYFNAGQVLVTNGDRTQISKIGVQGGTTSEEEAKKIGKETLVYENYEGKAIEDLKAGTIDALMMDLIAAKSVVKQNPGLQLSDQPLTNEYYGIMAKKENAKIIEQINLKLSIIKESGKLGEIIARWV